MKTAMTLFAAALTVGLLTVQAHAAGICSLSEETYTYGPFDELRIDKVYELFPYDDLADIPMEDFDRGNYHYTFLELVKADRSESETKGQTAAASGDTVIYTATFVCQGKAQSAPKSSQNQLEGADSFDPHPQIVLITLFGVMGLSFGGWAIYQYIKSKKRTGV